MKINNAPLASVCACVRACVYGASPDMILSEAPRRVKTRSTGLNWQLSAGTKQPWNTREDRGEEEKEKAVL